MKFKYFLKDKSGLLLFNFIFLLLTIFVIYLSPIKAIFFDTIIYIIIINLSLLIFYLSISYYRKNKFLNLLDESLNSNTINFISVFKTSYEEQIYINLINEYNIKCENIINSNYNKIKENQEIMEMWVHDIKMPIAIIKLIIEQNASSYFEKTLDEIDSEVMRIENSVERVLYLSKLDNFHKDFLVQEVDLQNIIREVIRKYSKYFIAKKINLSLDNLNHNVLSDKKWLIFIFDQLIGNALKYSNDNGNISITGELYSNYINIKIKDNGYGIKPEDMPRIFDKGFTGNNGRNNSKSTGLGLYLVKELCLKLNHDINVDSIYNEYSEFTIKLNIIN